MLTQEQINESWTVRSDNYNRYVEEEFETDRPEKWLQIIEANAPPRVRFGFWMLGAGRDSFQFCSPARVIRSPVWTALQVCWRTHGRMPRISAYRPF